MLHTEALKHKKWMNEAGISSIFFFLESESFGGAGRRSFTLSSKILRWVASTSLRPGEG